MFQWINHVDNSEVWNILKFLVQSVAIVSNFHIEFADARYAMVKQGSISSAL
jgi:hypothetical protein